ncbi:MAG: tandem-95 repeat protein, partial [Rhodobiaceae bacterium]|nr:tandem-95 repeat protein [Rhodobiaceae bacterium]
MAADIRQDSITFFLSVEAPSIAPQLSVLDHAVAVIGEAFVLPLAVFDPDGDPLTFDTDDLPAGASLVIDPTYGQAHITWTPTASSAGENVFTVSVTDNGNNGAGTPQTDTKTVTVLVRAANAAPILLPVGDQTVAEGETLTINVSATDPDGDPVTILVDNLPSGAVYDADNGRIVWTPNRFQSGVYEDIAITATDGQGTSTETISITVANTNAAPVVVPMALQTGREGAELSFKLVAGDIDNDPVVFEAVTALPAGAAFNTTTGTLTWTSGYGAAGTYNLRFAAVDPGGARGLVDVRVVIANVNRAPTIAVSNQAAVLGETLTFTPTFSDPDGAAGLTISYESLPPGATFNAQTGRVSWTPTIDQIGEYLAFASVSDGEAVVRVPFLIRASVAEEAPGVTIVSTPDFPVRPGQVVSVSVLTTSFTGIAGKTLRVNGTAVALDANGKARITAGTPGRVVLEATATDNRGNTTTVTSVIKVRDPADTAAPVVSLQPPVAYGPVTGTVNLSGSVADTNLDAWQLTLTELSTGETRVLAEGNSPVNGALAGFDPSGYANGFYALNLFAVDIAGRTSRTSQTFEVLSTAKDNFLRTETDLTLDIDGNTLALTRQFDSERPGTDGDFGTGWRASWWEFDIAVDPNSTGRAANGLSQGLSVDTRLQLTLPDGQRIGFSVSSTKTALAGGQVAVPVFTSTGAAGWTLEAVAPALTLSGGRFYVMETGRPWDPAASTDAVFRLTGPDGVVRVLDGAGRLVEQVFANGATIQVSDTGIVGPDGQLARFLRDADGHISEVRLSDGERTVYGYDADGYLATVRTIGGTGTQEFAYAADGTLIASAGTNGWWIDGNGTQRSLTAQVRRLSAPGGAKTVRLDGTGAAALAVTLRESEIASADGPVLLALEVNGGANAPAITGLTGVTMLGSETNGTRVTHLLSVETAGLHVLKLAGVANANVTYTLRIVGDVTGDGRVDGSDSAALDGLFGSNPASSAQARRADATGDGTIDAVDRGLLANMFGFTANALPSLTATDFSTYLDLAKVIDLTALGVDPEGDPLYYSLTGVVGGTAVLSADGNSVLFTPDLGFVGTAGFTITADDGHGASAPKTYGIAVKDVALLGIDISTRMVSLGVGGAKQLTFTGDFADQADVPLPVSYLDLAISNTDVATLTAGGLLIGDATGYGTLTATRGGAKAVTTYRVGNIDVFDLGLAAYGFDVYPDTVTL